MKKLYVICGISFTLINKRCVDYQVLLPVKGVTSTSRDAAFQEFMEDMLKDDDVRAEVQHYYILQQDVVGHLPVEFYRLESITSGGKPYVDDYVVYEVPLLK